MIVSEPIRSERFRLVTLDESFASADYLRWLSDPETTAFLETRFSTSTPESLRAFVAAQMASTDSYLFAIVVAETDAHIGNIKLGPINPHHHNASIGLFIGESDWWGKGVATEVIAALTAWAFEALGLAKVTAGAYASNVGSIRAFESCGFEREGLLRSQVKLTTGDRDDVVLLGKVNPRG